MSRQQNRGFKEHVLVSLDGCRHTPEFDWTQRPTEGETIWCSRCRGYRRVTALIDQYVVTCQDCVFLRRMGQSRLNAEILASKHHQKHRDHEIKMYLGKVLQYTWRRVSQDPDQDAFPGLEPEREPETTPEPTPRIRNQFVTIKSLDEFFGH